MKKPRSKNPNNNLIPYMVGFLGGLYLRNICNFDCAYMRSIYNFEDGVKIRKANRKCKSKKRKVKPVKNKGAEK